MKKLFVSILIMGCALFVVSGCTISRFSVLTMPNSQTIKVKLASTSEEMRIGLSGITEMKGYGGMWFIQQVPSQAVFWMKEMHLPLDIIYLNEQKRVLDVFDNLMPCPEQGVCPTVSSSGDAVKYILEVPAGMALKLGLAVDSQIKE